MDTNQEDKPALPACIAEYVTLIITKMRYRKKICQEVMDELTGHLEDAMRDCNMPQDEEKTAQELIDEFGDAKLLGTLMRRAKKRCRPLWKQAIIRSVQAALVALGLLVCYVFTIFLGEPTIRTDYLTLLNQASRPELMDEDNAWSHYERAAQLYQRRSKRISEFIRTGVGFVETLPRFTDLPKAQQAYLREHMQANMAAWAQFDETLRRLLRQYFVYGLVPYRIDPYSLQSPEQLARGNEHWVLDSAIRNWVAKSSLVSDTSYESELIMYTYMTGDDGRPESPEGITLPLATNDSRLELIAEIAEPLATLPFDASDELDRVFWQWLRHNDLPDNFSEGLNAGMLRYWMDEKQQTTDSLYAALPSFAREAMTSWITDNKPAWEEFVAGSLRSYCHREYTINSQDSNWLMNVLTPHLIELRDLGRLGKWRAQFSLARGDSTTAISDSLVVIRAGRHVQSAPTMIEQLIGLTLNGIGHMQLLRIASGADLSGEQLQQLTQQLQAIYPGGYPMINPEFERLAFLDTVQHVFTDGGLGGGHIVPKHYSSIGHTGEGLPIEPEVISALRVGLFHARRNDTLEQVNRIFDRIAQIKLLTPFQKHQSSTSTEELFEQLPPHKYALIHLLAPAVHRLFKLGYRAKAEHNGLLTVLALQRWHRKTNAYPATLNELTTAGLLAKVPADPFGSGALSYKRVDDSFTLYSFGTNLKDDDGNPGITDDGRIRKWIDRGDAVIWPVMD